MKVKELIEKLKGFEEQELAVRIVGPDEFGDGVVDTTLTSAVKIRPDYMDAYLILEVEE